MGWGGVGWQGRLVGEMAQGRKGGGVFDDGSIAGCGVG